MTADPLRAAEEALSPFAAEDFRSALSSIDAGIFVHTDAKCIAAALSFTARSLETVRAARAAVPADREALARRLDNNVEHLRKWAKLPKDPYPVDLSWFTRLADDFAAAAAIIRTPAAEEVEAMAKRPEDRRPRDGSADDGLYEQAAALLRRRR